MRKFVVAATFYVSAFFPFGSNANQTDPCIREFSRFGHFSDRSNVKSILPESTREQGITALNQLAELAARDSADVSLNTAEISEGTVASSNAIVKDMRDLLLAQGYKVRIEKRVATVFQAGAVEVELPSRDVLYVSPGTATGRFARELKRFEKDAAARSRDPNLPKEVADEKFETSVDPLLSILTRSRGFFTASSHYGYGIGMSPNLFFAREEVAVDILRHEIRHSKTYFDVLSSKNTPNRSSLASNGFSEMNPKSIYSKRFAVDETDGFTSNVRTAQADLGRLTEKMRKAMQSGEKPTEAEILGYQKDVEFIRQRGLFYATRVSQLNKSILEHSTIARARLADPMLSPAIFADRVLITSDKMYPGVKRVRIKLDENGKAAGAQIHIWVPDEVVDKGKEAIRAYAVQHCNELEKHALETERKNAVRIQDLKREPMSRIESPK